MYVHTHMLLETTCYNIQLEYYSGGDIYCMRAFFRTNTYMYIICMYAQESKILCVCVCV